MNKALIKNYWIFLKSLFSGEMIFVEDSKEYWGESNNNDFIWFEGYSFAKEEYLEIYICLPRFLVRILHKFGKIQVEF